MKALSDMLKVSGNKNISINSNKNAMSERGRLNNMSKVIDKEAVIKNKKSAIQHLNKLLESYILDSSEVHLKKADLISYWIKDYVRYLNFEETFDPKRYISYKRGDVIKVGFGFNVGAEYGGLHYAVVLDKLNDHASPVVTVAPLTSVKAVNQLERHNVSLGNEIYRLMKVKADAVAKSIQDERNELAKSMYYFDSISKMMKNSISGSDETAMLLSESKRILKNLRIQSEHLDSVADELDKIISEIARMKQGSVALLGQITTISKMRIYDPQKSKDVLYGISLSEDNMVKINEKIKELYVFSE